VFFLLAYLGGVLTIISPVIGQHCALCRFGHEAENDARPGEPDGSASAAAAPRITGRQTTLGHEDV
jgi:hypothetical protein